MWLEKLKEKVNLEGINKKSSEAGGAQEEVHYCSRISNENYLGMCCA